MDDNINLKDINWNQLDFDSFSKISDKLNIDLKRETKEKRKKLKQKPIVVEIEKNKYEIPYKEYVRFKNLKSEAARIKFKKSIIVTYKKLIEL